MLRCRVPGKAARAAPAALTSQGIYFFEGLHRNGERRKGWVPASAWKWGRGSGKPRKARNRLARAASFASLGRSCPQGNLLFGAFPANILFPAAS